MEKHKGRLKTDSPFSKIFISLILNSTVYENVKYIGVYISAPVCKGPLHTLLSLRGLRKTNV